MGNDVQPARVVSDPAVMLGKPVIAGTRITVELILEELAAGRSPEEIHDNFPRLPADALSVALAFSRRTGDDGRADD